MDYDGESGTVVSVDQHGNVQRVHGGTGNVQGKFSVSSSTYQHLWGVEHAGGKILALQPYGKVMVVLDGVTGKEIKRIGVGQQVSMAVSPDGRYALALPGTWAEQQAALVTVE